MYSISSIQDRKYASPPVAAGAVASGTPSSVDSNASTIPYDGPILNDQPEDMQYATKGALWIPEHNPHFGFPGYIPYDQSATKPQVKRIKHVLPDELYSFDKPYGPFPPEEELFRPRKAVIDRYSQLMFNGERPNEIGTDDIFMGQHWHVFQPKSGVFSIGQLHGLTPSAFVRICPNVIGRIFNIVEHEEGVVTGVDDYAAYINLYMKAEKALLPPHVWQDTVRHQTREYFQTNIAVRVTRSLLDVVRVVHGFTWQGIKKAEVFNDPSYFARRGRVRFPHKMDSLENLHHDLIPPGHLHAFVPACIPSQCIQQDWHSCKQYMKECVRACMAIPVTEEWGSNPPYSQQRQYTAKLPGEIFGMVKYGIPAAEFQKCFVQFRDTGEPIVIPENSVQGQAPTGYALLDVVTIYGGTNALAQLEHMIGMQVSVWRHKGCRTGETFNLIYNIDVDDVVNHMAPHDQFPNLLDDDINFAKLEFAKAKYNSEQTFIRFFYTPFTRSLTCQVKFGQFHLSKSYFDITEIAPKEIVKIPNKELAKFVWDATTLWHCFIMKDSQRDELIGFWFEVDSYDGGLYEISGWVKGGPPSFLDKYKGEGWLAICKKLVDKMNSTKGPDSPLQKATEIRIPEWKAKMYVKEYTCKFHSKNL